MEEAFYLFTLGVDYPRPIVPLEEARRKSSYFFWSMRKTTPVKQDGQRILRKHTLPER